MTNRERTGFRDQAYSTWHRQLDDRLSFLDIDWVERCDTCKRPLAICELALDTGRDDKAYYTTQRLAKALDAFDRQGTVRGFVVLYGKNPRGQITGFRVREVHPRETDFVPFTIDQWAKRLYSLRWCHPVTPKPRAPQILPHTCQWMTAGNGWRYCVICEPAYGKSA